MTPATYARSLLDSLGLRHVSPAVEDARPPGLLWARSGAMWLSGHAQGKPRACPAPLAACAQGAWLTLSTLSGLTHSGLTHSGLKTLSELRTLNGLKPLNGPKFLTELKTPRGQKLDPLFDAYRLLGERAAITGLTRRGRRSPGGACQLLGAADGALALNLAREDDRDLLPAWVESPLASDEELAAAVSERRTEILVRRGRLLGLAVAPLCPPRPPRAWFQATRCAPARRGSRAVPLVLDLSALWAGPLCGQLLSQCGARVIKLESSARPDGARFGPARFFDLLNAGKESVALDLRRRAGRDRLRALLEKADIVIESTRPRGLEQMGIRAADFLSRRPGMVWLGITGYGRAAPMRDWIAYGDDAGVAAGLSWLMGGDRGDPVFGGDAVADPLTGLHAAALALAAWRAGGGLLLDISLRDVVAHCIGAGSAASAHGETAAGVSRPVARTATASAADLGADTSRVLQELL